jgi:uncharacterized protein YciI
MMILSSPEMSLAGTQPHVQPTQQHRPPHSAGLLQIHSSQTLILTSGRKIEIREIHKEIHLFNNLYGIG